jgi:DNA-binding response OmpR family regulator
MIRETESNRIRILYVEDDKDLRLPISQILTILSYEVICVDNGKQGIETARSKPDTWAIPIFVLTAYSDAKNRKLCKEAGIEKFFVKPIDVKEVDAAIKEILKRQTQERVSQLGDLLQVVT